MHVSPYATSTYVHKWANHSVYPPNPPASIRRGTHQARRRDRKAGPAVLQLNMSGEREDPAGPPSPFSLTRKYEELGHPSLGTRRLVQ